MSNPRISSEQKSIVAQRAGYCCEYCLSQMRYAPDPFAVDHIVPSALGGANDLSNLAYACLGWNGRKFTATTANDPVTGEIAPLYNPRIHQWLDHFGWSTDFTLMIGLTPAGRATIERLQLNRPGVVNLRRMLYQVDQHPPAL